MAKACRRTPAAPNSGSTSHDPGLRVTRPEPSRADLPAPGPDLLASVVRPEIAAMAAYAVPSAAGLIKLDAMENPYSLPEHLRAELAQRLAAVALNRYPAPVYLSLIHISEPTRPY